MAKAAKNKGGPSVKVDLSDVETKTLYPEGDYKVKLGNGSIEEGTEFAYISWSHEITEGKFQGKSITNDNTSLSPKALWRLRGLMEAAGLEIPSGEFSVNKAWVEECVENSGEFFVTVEHEKNDGRTYCRIVDYFQGDDEAVEEKPKGDKGKKVEKPPKGGKAKPEPEPDGEPDFDEMDKDELKEFIDEKDLDVDADDFPKLVKLRAAVKEAWEARDENGGEDAEKVSEDAINEMGTKELQKLVDEHELDIELDGTTKAKRRAVIKAMKKKDLIED